MTRLDQEEQEASEERTVDGVLAAEAVRGDRCSQRRSSIASRREASGKSGYTSPTRPSLTASGP
jgi:hypothetical protein